MGLSSDEVLYNQIVTIPNIVSYQITEPQDGMVTNKTKYFFDVIPNIDLEGDEIRFRVLYSLINDEKVYTSSEVLKEEEVNLTFSSEGEWEWWLEIAEYDQGILIPGSEQVTETRTLFIDQTAPTGDFGFKSLTNKELSSHTNNENIKLSPLAVTDKSGVVNSGLKGIYLWNGRTRPTDFYPVELADLPDAINENILSPLATGAQGVYIEIASSLESPLFEETIEEIPWRLSGGSDGERSVSMEIVDLAGNISTPVEKSITIDTTPPADPTFNPCTFDGSKLVFNWYLLDKDADLEAFYVKQVDGSIEKVAKVQDEHINNQYNGSFEIVIDYENAQQYNQPVKIEIYATDLAGNKSAVVNFTGYTKAKLGEEGILTAGYNEEYKHYFTLPVTGGIAKEQTLEISKDPNFETIDKIVRLEADDLFVVSELNPHGEYFYRLVATNHDGVRTLGLGKKYNVPNQPPPTPENLSPVGFASTDVKFIFNKVNEDSDGDSLTYQVYWDEGENNSFKPVDWDEEQACFSVTISPSDHGKTFNWYVEVDDGHGPIIKSELATFVLDANAPILKLKKPNTVYTSQQELEFTVSDDLSGLQKIEYQLTDAATNNLIGEVQTLDPTAGSILLPEGYYHLTVTAIDKAGNQTTEQVNNLRVDRTSPQLSEVVLSLPSNGSKYLTNTPQIPLTWKAVDAQSGIKGLLYWVQTDLGQPLGKAKYMALSPSGGTYALSIDLDAGNGSYYLALAALDRAGNQSAPEQIPMPILLDTTPPEVVFELAGFHNQGADFYLTPDNKLAIKEVGQEDPESGIAEKRFIVVETGSNKVITDSANWTEILDTTFLSGKSYQLIYRVTNKVGLSTEVRSVEFTYDHTPPEGLSLKLPQTPLAKGEIASFLAAATEQETRIVRYQLGIGSAYDKRELSSLIPGNSDGWISINTANTSTEFRVEIPDSDDGTYYLTLEQNTFSFNESKPQRYTLKAKVTDLAGNTGEEKEQLIRVNAPPQITLPVEINTTPGAPTRFTAMIYDPDGQEGDTFEYLWDPGDGSTEITGEEAEHRYNNTITDYTLTLRVKDKDGGMAEATTTVKVRNTARGLLYMDECWSGEHRLYGDVTVPEGITLTIMPGTEVIVDGIPGDTGYEHTLFIKGSLEIQGDSLGVTFHSVTEEVDGWKGIYLEGQARIDGLSLMQAERGLTVTETAELTVTNSIFHNNLIGIHCYGSHVVILNTRFTNNAWYGLKEDAGGRPEVRDCIFSVNGTHYYHAGKTDLTAAELNALENNAGNQYE